MVAVCVYACLFLERYWISLERNGSKELRVQESDLAPGLCMVCPGATTLPKIVVIELQGMVFTWSTMRMIPGSWAGWY